MVIRQPVGAREEAQARNVRKKKEKKREVPRARREGKREGQKRELERC